MKRGTGYRATHASWEDGTGKTVATYRIDHTARPWGPDGGPYLKDSTLAPPEGAPLEAYWRRYAEGRSSGVHRSAWPIGASGEALPRTYEALKRWYAEQPATHRAEWDGEPTIEEGYDAAFGNAYPGPFYGGGGDVVVIASAADWDAHFFLLRGAAARGELRLGEEWSIRLVGDTSDTRFLILWMPEGSSPPPPPPPDDDDPEDPPVPTPKPLSPVPQRVAELGLLLEAVFDRARPTPWLRRLWAAADDSGLLELALTELVRAKRKLHGEPEAGR